MLRNVKLSKTLTNERQIPLSGNPPAVLAPNDCLNKLTLFVPIYLSRWVQIKLTILQWVKLLGKRGKPLPFTLYPLPLQNVT